MSETRSEEEANANYDIHLEAILENKVGYGKAQFKLVIPMLFMTLNLGSQMMALGLLLPVAHKQWNLTTLEESIGLTIITIGTPIGSILQGYSDQIGRSPFVLLNAAISLIFGLLTAISWSFPVFVISRFFIAVAIGIFLPLIGCYTAEIAPDHARPSLLSNTYMLWAGGYMFCLIFGYAFLPQNQWRIVSLILCLPSLLTLLSHYLFGRETLHYLWAKKETV